MSRPHPERLTLADQLRYAESYAERAEAAISRGSPETHEADVKRATAAWDKVSKLKHLIEQESAKAAKPVKPAPIILANGMAETIEFIPAGNDVDTVWKGKGAKWGERTRMTVEAARAKYAALLSAGWYRW